MGGGTSLLATVAGKIEAELYGLGIRVFEHLFQEKLILGQTMRCSGEHDGIPSRLCICESSRREAIGNKFDSHLHGEVLTHQSHHLLGCRGLRSWRETQYTQLTLTGAHPH